MPDIITVLQPPLERKHSVLGVCKSQMKGFLNVRRLANIPYFLEWSVYRLLFDHVTGSGLSVWCRDLSQLARP